MSDKPNRGTPLARAILSAWLMLLSIVFAGALLGFITVPQMEHNVRAIDGAGIGAALSLIAAVPASLVTGVVVFVVRSRK